jgi:CheY-like chemotaxis protein
VTRALLEREGHEVRSAAGAEEALRIMSELGPELVLVDIQLGSGGADEGIALAWQLRDASPGGAARIIAFTADATELNHERYRLAGIEGVITKPLELDAPLSELVKVARERFEGGIS